MRKMHILCLHSGSILVPLLDPAHFFPHIGGERTSSHFRVDKDGLKLQKWWHLETHACILWSLLQ